MPWANNVRRKPESTPKTLSENEGMVTAAPTRFRSSMERATGAGEPGGLGEAVVPWAWQSLRTMHLE
jgi:hypothetical protein